jgi:hypothetical protein
VRLKRPSGRPWTAGSSQAIALTSATCSGGKTARAPRAWFIAQPIEALGVKASSPMADDPGRGVKTGRDLGVGLAFGGVEDDPGALDLAPGTLLGAGDSPQLAALLLA